MAGPIPSISAQNVSVPKPHRPQVTPRNLRTESANVTQSIHPPHQKQASNGLPLILADYRFQGNTLDSSSLQKHCTNNGATLTTGPFSIPNSAYHFANSAVMDCGSNTFLATDMKTIEVMVKFDSFDVRNREIVSKSRAGSGVELITGIGRPDEGYLCLFVMSHGLQANACERTDRLNLGQWYHVVGTQNGPRGPIKLYVDGVEKGSGVAPESITDGGPLRLGNWNDVGFENRPFDGSLGGVTIYSKALSPEEVLASYTSKFHSNTVSPSKMPTPWPSYVNTRFPSYANTFSPTADMTTDPSEDVIGYTSTPSLAPVVTPPHRQSSVFEGQQGMIIIGLICGIGLGILAILYCLAKKQRPQSTEYQATPTSTRPPQQETPKPIPIVEAVILDPYPNTLIRPSAPPLKTTYL